MTEVQLLFEAYFSSYLYSHFSMAPENHKCRLSKNFILFVSFNIDYLNGSVFENEVS